MMFGSNVAPRRKVIAKKYVPWACKCKTNPGYLVRCIGCKTERP